MIALRCWGFQTISKRANDSFISISISSLNWDAVIAQKMQMPMITIEALIFYIVVLRLTILRNNFPGFNCVQMVVIVNENDTVELYQYAW